jgi:hypothetical protein
MLRRQIDHSQVNVFVACLSVANCSVGYTHLNGEFEGLATTTPGSVWAYDSRLAKWLSSPAAAASPTAMAFTSNPAY